MVKYVWQVWDKLETPNGDEPILLGTFKNEDDAMAARKKLLDEHIGNIESQYYDAYDDPPSWGIDGYELTELVSIKKCTVK